MAFQFNANDPRYQREKQRVAAKGAMRGGTPVFGAMENVSARHAAQQAQTRETFNRLGIESKLAEQRFGMAKERIKMADKERGLSKDRLAFSKKMFGKEMDDRKSNLRWTIGLGLGTAGLGYMEGRRRANKLEEERKTRRGFEERYAERQQKSNETLAAILARMNK